MQWHPCNIFTVLDGETGGYVHDGKDQREFGKRAPEQLKTIRQDFLVKLGKISVH